MAAGKPGNRPPNRGGRITPAMAKAVWESIKRPTAVKVADAFNQAGADVTSRTITSFKNNNWQEADGVDTESDFQKAESALDIAIPLLTKSALSRTEDILPTDGAELGDVDGEVPNKIDTALGLVNAVRMLLNQMTSEGLLIQSMRRGTILSIMVKSSIEQNIGWLVRHKTEELAKLITALAVVDQSNAGYDKRILDRREREMKVVGAQNGQLSDPQDATLQEKLDALGIG